MKLQRLAYFVTYPLIIFYAPLFARSRVLLLCNGEFLAVKGKFSDNRWSLPGGGVKRGETRRQAAIREIKEEVGIDLNDKDLKTLIPYGFYRNKGLLYRGEIFITRLPHKKQDFEENHEIEAVAWLPVNTDNRQIGKIVAEALKRI